MFSGMLLLGGCGDFWDPPAPGEVDYDVSRKVSDALAENLVNADAKNLFALLDPGYHTVVANEKELERFMGQMEETFGRVEAFQYRHNETARRMDGPLNRPSRLFWYQVATSRHPMGKYFLKIEVVPAPYGGGLKVSGFGLLTFDTLPKFLQ